MSVAVLPHCLDPAYRGGAAHHHRRQGVSKLADTPQSAGFGPGTGDGVTVGTLGEDIDRYQDDEEYVPGPDRPFLGLGALEPRTVLIQCHLLYILEIHLIDPVELFPALLCMGKGLVTPLL